MTPEEKAQKGLSLLKEAILDLLAMHLKGLRNCEIATELDIHSDYLGSNKDFLSWSILGLLLNDKMIMKKDKRYFLNPE